MMTRYLAAAAAPKVPMNALCPRLTMSGKGGPAIHPGIQAPLNRMPMGRVAHPTEVERSALHLASGASSYTTETLLMVTGGRSW
jgi:NAD(P)-dependent dehydrogenase (short-subunit alcohol dehydrogenase family)